MAISTLPPEDKINVKNYMSISTLSPRVDWKKNKRTKQKLRGGEPRNIL